MANQPLHAGKAEADAFATIRFQIEKPGQTTQVYQVDCLVDSAIIGIKEDQQEDLGAPPQLQQWYHNNQLMSDDKRLLDYGIDGCEEEEITVRVSSS